MSTTSVDGGNAGWRKFDINCYGRLPISITFTDNPRIVVSAERKSHCPGGKLLRYRIHPDQSDQRNTPEELNEIDRAVISKDGKWIVIIAGTSVTVRNLTTDEVVEVDKHASGVPVYAVDISPDSNRFATGSQDKTARIFSINTGKQLLELNQHKDSVVGVKFSPDGKLLATAAFGDSIRVWEACKGYCSLRWTSKDVIHGPTASTDTPVQSLPLEWFANTSNHVFTISSGLIKVFFPHTQYYALAPFRGSVPASNGSTLYSFATCGRITACAAGSLLSFWDTFSSSRIGPTITFQDPILSLALSSDGSYLACGKGDKITVYLLRDILPLHFIVDPTLHLPFMNMTHGSFHPWVAPDSSMGGGPWQETQPPTYHSLANQALISAQSQDWQSALSYANQSLQDTPSIIGHIALIRALIGQGQQEPTYEGLDTFFGTCSADESRLLLLIKAILFFLSGKREEAIKRINELMRIADDSEKYNCLQVLGNMYLSQGNRKQAFESFESANKLSFFRRGHHLIVIFLIFGPSFEECEISLRRPLREAVTA